MILLYSCVMTEQILSEKKNSLSRTGIPGSHVFLGLDKLFMRILKFCIFFRKTVFEKLARNIFWITWLQKLSVLTCGSRDRTLTQVNKNRYCLGKWMMTWAKWNPDGILWKKKFVIWTKSDGGIVSSHAQELTTHPRLPLTFLPAPGKII